MHSDSIEGIYDTLKQCALISKSAGGIGLNVHCIRSTGSYIAGVGGILLTTRERGQWLSGRVLDSRPRGRGFEPHGCHCVVSLSKKINPSLVLASRL